MGHNVNTYFCQCWVLGVTIRRSIFINYINSYWIRLYCTCNKYSQQRKSVKSLCSYCITIIIQWTVEEHQQNDMLKAFSRTKQHITDCNITWYKQGLIPIMLLSTSKDYWMQYTWCSHGIFLPCHTSERIAGTFLEHIIIGRIYSLTLQFWARCTVC